MGRSLSTQTDLFNALDAKLKGYRRALRMQDRLAFDSLMVYARKHLPSASLASHLYPLEIFLLSITLEQEKNAENLYDLYKKLLNLYEDLDRRMAYCEENSQNLKEG